MNLLNLSVCIAVLANAYCKGSGAEESSLLIAKKSEGTPLKPENALVIFLYTPGEYTIGGGALLSRTSVIAPFIIFSRFYERYRWQLSNFRVVIGLNPFRNNRLDLEHYIEDIKHNVGPDCDKKDAIALITINPISNSDADPPSWVQHIPIATRSYTPGLHPISESFVLWDEKNSIANVPISGVSVDGMGIISTQITVAYEAQYSIRPKDFYGGFITRKGTLAGLAFKYYPVQNMDGLIQFNFLPVNGNNTLIKDSKDKDIKILDIDSSRTSGKKKRKRRKPSDIVNTDDNDLYI